MSKQHQHRIIHVNALSERIEVIYLTYQLPAITLLIATLLAGCASYVPRPMTTPPIEQVNELRAVNDVQVATTILSDEQAAQHYGVDLASRGLQATWLRIRNGSNRGLWFLVTALDPDY